MDYSDGGRHNNGDGGGDYSGKNKEGKSVHLVRPFVSDFVSNDAEFTAH
jgi:hypothetical protein